MAPMLFAAFRDKADRNQKASNSGMTQDNNVLIIEEVWVGISEFTSTPYSSIFSAREVSEDTIPV